jgi:hypothetical protein
VSLSPSVFASALKAGTRSTMTWLLPCLVLALVCSLGGISWAQAADTQAADTKDSDKKVDKEFYTPKQRLDAMHAAALYKAKAVSDADIMEGRKQDKKQFQFHFNDKVICDFATPGKDMGGKTPKFACKITSVESADGKVVQTLTADMDDSEPLKIKFGANDNEVYAELPATRLMWALGYYADSWFPVRVECHNCPEDPISGSGAKATRTYDPATIVRKYPGHKMYEVGKAEEGWSWDELSADNGRPLYEKDGLRLLAAFIKHSDNKPPQQRLVCDKVHVDEKTQPFTTTCDNSIMLVQDVGATFGGGGLFTDNTKAKMNLHVWSSTKLWNKVGTEGAPKQCQAELQNSLTAHGGLKNPNISEDGRRFLAGLMCQLTDEQIKDLFVLSRAVQMPEHHNKDGSFKAGVTEDSVIQEWVTAFKQKREDLAKGRCEWKQKPADLTVIDNPAGLATVPNYCTAKPY